MRKLWIIAILICYPLWGSLDTRERLLNLFAGEWIARGLYVATQLEIAEHLQDEPKGIEELAKETFSDKEALYRLLHMLASVGVFEEEEGQIFKNSPLSQFLIKTDQDSLHHLSLFYGGEIHASLDKLLDSVKRGKPAFEEVFKEPVFSYFKHHTEREALFQKAMKEKSKGVIEGVIANCDFRKFDTICDIGGGYGQLLRRLLHHYPHLTGTLYELPAIVQKVREDKLFIENGRSTIIAGDFFDSVPKGKDAYILKSVLHDWDDKRAEEILQNCYKAMEEKSRLFIVEAIIQPKDQSIYANCMDMVMLSVTGGKERSLHSFTHMLENSGFTLEGLYPTATEFSILEVRKK